MEFKRFDQLTGKFLPISLDFHELTLNGINATPVFKFLKPHIFYDNIITEARDPHEEIIKLLKASRVGHKHDENRNFADGQQSSSTSDVTFSVQSVRKLFGLPNFSVWDVWISVCALYITIHFIIVWAWPKVVIIALRQIGFDLGQNKSNFLMERKMRHRNVLTYQGNKLKKSQSVPNVRFTLPPDLIDYNPEESIISDIKRNRTNSISSRRSLHSFIGRWANLF